MKRELFICVLCAAAAMACCVAHGQTPYPYYPPQPPQYAMIYRPVVVPGQWVATPRYTFVGEYLFGPRFVFVPSPPQQPQQSAQAPPQPTLPPPQQ